MLLVLFMTDTNLKVERVFKLPLRFETNINNEGAWANMPSTYQS